MRRIFALTCLALGASLCGVARQPLRLEQCRAQAQANYPLAKQRGLIEKSREYSVANAGKVYLPQVALSARATYQSEVTSLPIDLSNMNIPTPDKDQYAATIEVSQALWDGGAARSQRGVLHASSEVERRQLRVDMRTLDDRVNQLFFGILLVDEQLKQNRLLQDELQRSHSRVASYLANGLANQADLDAVRVEQLNAMQGMERLKSSRQAYRAMLGELTGMSIADSAAFEKPFMGEASADWRSDSLPEVQLMQAQAALYEAQKSAITAGNMPRLGVFVQGGYGKPGLNMLSNELDAFYVAGARLSWNFGGLYTQANERKKVEVKKSAVEVQKETFLLNTRQHIAQLEAKIAGVKEVMKMDDEIIALRGSVKKSAEARVANGTMSVIDLLREVNAESLARQTKSLHEIELLMAVANLKYVLNE
jgi:outer membrane protein TolC